MPLDYCLAKEGDLRTEGWQEHVRYTPAGGGGMERWFMAWRSGRVVSVSQMLKFNDEKDWVALKAQAWDTLDKACGIWPEPEPEKEKVILCPCGASAFPCAYPNWCDYGENGV